MPKYKKIEYAPQISVEQFQDVADIFMKQILDMSPGDYLITDESSIDDFDVQIDSTENILKKIKQIYSVDVSDIEGLLLVKIFERLRVLGKL